MGPTFLEFFAGGGMARAGLGSGWRCLFANDIDPKKAAIYRRNWGQNEFHEADIDALSAEALPVADLAWASFPCQDLSLAGTGRGLGGDRSGLFWAFWRLVFGMRRKPRVIVLENVEGALSSCGGQDFRDICRALASLDYRFGALVCDAVHFLPQSRPRLFLIAARADSIPPTLIDDRASPHWTTERLRERAADLPRDLAARWRWWALPSPPRRTIALADIVVSDPLDTAWHDAAATERLLGLMSARNRAKVDKALASGERAVGTVYRRTRVEGGVKRQRAEIRFDDIAGCLRTPRGGSSRQIIVVVDGGRVRSRLLSKHEAAALMGYQGALPESYNEAYHLLGDGLAVPVVRFLSDHLLLPLVAAPASDIAA